MKEYIVIPTYLNAVDIKSELHSQEYSLKFIRTEHVVTMREILDIPEDRAGKAKTMLEYNVIYGNDEHIIYYSPMDMWKIVALMEDKT